MIQKKSENFLNKKKTKIKQAYPFTDFVSSYVKV